MADAAAEATIDEIIEGAWNHLAAQHRAMAREVAERGETIKPEEVEWNPVPVAVFWALLPEFRPVFYRHPLNPQGAVLLYRFLAGPGSPEFSPSQPPDQPARHPWMNTIDFSFDGGLLARPQPEEVLRSKARLALQEHLGVRRFFQKLAWIQDLGAATKHARENAQVIGGRQVDPETYYRLCIVLALAAIEALLSDLFYAFEADWFSHLSSRRQRDHAMNEVVRCLALRGRKRSEWRIIKSSVDRDVAFANYVRSNRRRLSFQDMRSRNAGAKWAYKTFFGIQLPALLEGAEKDTWRTFVHVGDHRQESLHPGEPEEATREGVNKALDRIRKAQCRLLAALMERNSVDEKVRL